MNNSDYIIPTKKSPVFTAENDWFGFIESSLWKQHLVEGPDDLGSLGNTWATNYLDALRYLHEWIQENTFILDEYPKAKFTIRLVDGSWNHKLNQKKEEIVYTISARKAKRLLI